MNTPHLSSWTQDDFESLSWHDNRIHAIAFTCPGDGYDYNLTFDIDYIVEWIKTPNGSFRFVVAPAMLVFCQARNILIEARLNYREPPTIDRIEREDISTAAEQKIGCRPYRWTIFLQSSSTANNRIVLESAAFEQKLRKSPTTQDSQWLEIKAR